jgi:hypothetical protein
MGDTGLEHIQESREKPRIASQGAAESGTVSPFKQGQPPSELAEVIAGWSRLPASVQGAILMIIRASV